MSKEMIISVNGREKKIAIIEDGQVTEFYIERGEDNAGIVGNIYKGRVMRVLPGMQSAFVDIGLERDAFLYVSDFFDEEEEIERIVIEKGKQHTSRDDADKEVTDELHKSRLKRDKKIDNTQEKAEIEIEPDDSEEENSAKYDSQDSGDQQKRKSNRKRGRRGKSEEENKSEKSDKSEKEEKADKSRRNDNSGRNDNSDKEDKREDKREDKEDKREDKEDKKDNRGTRGRKQKSSRKERDENKDNEENEKREDNFGKSKKTRERPVPTFEFEDSGFERIIDDEDADTGEMLKDAMMQEAIIDRVRAIEFDMESTDSAEVGSLIDSVKQDNGFQRVADEDEENESFDDNKTKGKAKNSRSRKTSTRTKKNAVKEENETDSDEQSSDTDEDSKEETSGGKRRSGGTKNEPVSKKKPRGKKAKKAVTDTEETEAETDEKDSKKSASRSRKTTGGRKTSSRRRTPESKKESTKENEIADGEASVSENTEVSEMAVRRGSRGGRRSSQDESGGKDPAKTATHKDKGYKASEAEQTITADDAIASAEFSSGGKDNNNRSRNSGGRNSRRRDKSPPKISDLLQQGQEILVQIAKEPIARKGARITSHIALPGRYLVYMPTIEHLGVSRKIESAKERGRLRTLLQKVIQGENIASGGFIVRTAGTGKSEDDIRDDAIYLAKTWNEIRKDAEKSKSPKLIHQDLDIVQRLIRDQLSDDFTAIRVDSEEEYLRTVEFVNRIQPKMVKRVKFHTLDQPILETYGVAAEIDKALKHRVWLKSGGYLVINQTEALIAIDVNTGKFVGKGNERLEDTITKTNMEAVKEISRQIRLRDLGGIIVLDLIDMEDRRNRQKVLQALQEQLTNDKSPTKVLSFNDFGLVIMTRKRVKQSLERTLCSPCNYCEGAGWIKSTETVCYEILEEARSLSKNLSDVRHTTLRVHPEVAATLRKSERAVFDEIEDYLGVVDITGDSTIHQEQFDFAFI